MPLAAHRPARVVLSQLPIGNGTVQDDSGTVRARTHTHARLRAMATLQASVRSKGTDPR